MFHDLDSTLTTILDDPTAPAELHAADVSFETPDKNFAPGQPTVNLFLFEVTENRARRDQVLHAEKVGDLLVRRFPPLRVNRTYLVTTWSNQVGALRVAEEHLLLGQAFQWLSRFGTVPDAFLQRSLIGPAVQKESAIGILEGGFQAAESRAAADDHGHCGVRPDASKHRIRRS